MKIEVKKKLPIAMAIIVSSIFTCTFASLSIYDGDNWMFRALAQGSLCLTMLLNGVNSFIYQKQKKLGILLWLVSGFLLFVMISTIYVEIHKNIF